jgi:hypothetical protein
VVRNGLSYSIKVGRKGEGERGCFPRGDSSHSKIIEAMPNSLLASPYPFPPFLSAKHERANVAKLYTFMISGPFKRRSPKEGQVNTYAGRHGGDCLAYLLDFFCDLLLKSPLIMNAYVLAT